jgi:AraC-like DNA-binding protein
MPIFMDLHIVPGVNAKDVADAHSMDVLMEKEHSCKCLTYWIDELRGYVFCLIDAPDKESVIELHTRAHGLVPNKIIEVEPSLVHAFLGRITDPDSAIVTESGLKILDDTSYRIIMHLQLEDFVLLRNKEGKQRSSELTENFRLAVKKEIELHHGREVTYETNEIIVSFVEGQKAFEAAAAIASMQHKFPQLGIKISLHAGEPVAKSDTLFGETVQMLKRMNIFLEHGGIAITTGIRELINNSVLEKNKSTTHILTPSDETFLTSLINTLEERYTEETFDLNEYCRTMAMSQSQLYRKCTKVSMLSPNILLRNYRLHRAKDEIRTTHKTVSQISLESGFTSSSYFTKCFKSRWGLLPNVYQDLSREI